MKYQCARWKGPISVAVFIASDDPLYNDTSAVESIRDDLVQRQNCTANQLTIQVVHGSTARDFPINLLRNTDLNQQLMRHAKELAADHKLALVLPAFELKRQCKGKTTCLPANLATMPETKQQLLSLWESTRQINTFLRHYPPAQGSTLYDQWKNQSDDELVPISCLQSNRYEPFTVFRYCRDLPPFQTAFYGYGKDKDAWMMQTRRSGYHYKQTGASYIVHYPHGPSPARLHFNGGPNGELMANPKNNTAAFKRGQIDRTYVAFRNWLSATIPDETVVSLCEDAEDDNHDLWIQ
jgi:Glycosyl-transferase for dystroglycan